MKILYLPSFVMTTACIINRSNETISQLIRSVSVRNSYHPAIIPEVQPPVLDPSPKSVDDCGWTTMDYLGIAFILVCCCAVIGGICACVCCCSKAGRSSNFQQVGQSLFKKSTLSKIFQLRYGPKDSALRQGKLQLAHGLLHLTRLRHHVYIIIKSCIQ